MISRRKWLSYAIVLGGTGTRSLALIPNAKGDVIAGTSNINQGLWTYHKTDLHAAQEIAYRNHFKGGCCYAVFSGILSQLASQFGDPYQGFPMKMMEYGMAGVGGYGSLCGSLNGGAAAIGLFFEGSIRESLIKQLFQWYENTEFPLYKPERSISTDAEIVHSTAQSVLCRDSLGMWSKQSGFSWGREQRERCARMDADVCRKTAELLNAHLESISGAAAANSGLK
jgi:hypothetical protein